MQNIWFYPQLTGLAGSMSVRQVFRSVYDIVKFCGFRWTIILSAFELRPLDWLRLRPLPFDEGSKSNAGKMDQTWSKTTYHVSLRILLGMYSLYSIAQSDERKFCKIDYLL